MADDTSYNDNADGASPDITGGGYMDTADRLTNNGYKWTGGYDENNCEIWEDGNGNQTTICSGSSQPGSGNEGGNNSNSNGNGNGNANNNPNNYGNENFNPFNNPFGPQNVGGPANAAPSSTPTPNPFSGFTNPFNQQNTPPPVNAPATQNRRTVVNQSAALASANKVASPNSPISSWNTVTAPNSLNPKTAKQTNDTIETHFIEIITGRYLGESSTYYKLVRDGVIVEQKDITFPLLKKGINIRAIQNVGLNADGDAARDWDNQDFSRITPALIFDKQGYKQAYQDMTNQKLSKKVDNYLQTKTSKEELVEESLAIFYDGGITISAKVLCDDLNTINSCPGLNALIIQQTDRSLLLPSETWKAALADYAKDRMASNWHTYSVLADNFKHPVIGICHTHPDPTVYKFDAPGTYKYNQVQQTQEAAHSDQDLNWVRRNLLPDVIITYKLDDIKKIEVLTKDGAYTKVANSLNEFLDAYKMQDVLFNNIICKYKR